MKAVQRLRQAKVIPRGEAEYYKAMIEDARASASQTVLEHLNQIEISKAATAVRKNKTLEKVIFDDAI